MKTPKRLIPAGKPFDAQRRAYEPLIQAIHEWIRYYAFQIGSYMEEHLDIPPLSPRELAEELLIHFNGKPCELYDPFGLAYFLLYDVSDTLQIMLTTQATDEEQLTAAIACLFIHVNERYGDVTFPFDKRDWKNFEVDINLVKVIEP